MNRLVRTTNLVLQEEHARVRLKELVDLLDVVAGDASAELDEAGHAWGCT